MKPSKVFRFDGSGIVVTYEIRRCIHAAECVRKLPAVFDTKRKPWVDPEAATAAEVARVIEQCPTGALKYERKDDGPRESAPAANRVKIAANGPLYLHGRVRVESADGQPIAMETRMALCRCGKSSSKPFCDGSHVQARFTEPGLVSKPQVQSSGKSSEGTLTICCQKDASLAVAGAFELTDSSGAVVARGDIAWLCRCGGSRNKPFCDGAHKTVGFSAS